MKLYTHGMQLMKENRTFGTVAGGMSTNEPILFASGSY